MLLKVVDVLANVVDGDNGKKKLPFNTAEEVLLKIINNGNKSSTCEYLFSEFIQSLI